MSNYRSEAERAAARHFSSPQDRAYFLRQMGAEANFTDATSPAGAQGPAQIMPATARGWGVKNVHDPKEAYDAAARNMAKYLRSYGGDWSKALTAYNAGPGAVGGKLPAETVTYIAKILGHAGDTKAGKTVTDVARTKAAAGTKGTPGGVDTAGALVDELLGGSGKLHHVGSGSSLLSRVNQRIATGAYTTAPTPGKPALAAAAKGKAADTGAATDGSTARRFIDRANVADRANNAGKLDYKWGGGHAGKVDTGNLVPLDCSGAVSYATGINPRVASQFKSWGKPGEGGDITVYAKDTHVLAKVRGRDGNWHFFGTSGANPGGGAGWIPADKISPSYLKGFTVRHA
jgi:hypothetical protein